MKTIFAGVLFAALWGSGSVATKAGLQVSHPLLLIDTRFFLAAVLMLTVSLLVRRERLPRRSEWKPLLLGGLLNMAIYPAAFVFAMKEVTAGIGTLAGATCPLIISVLNAVWLRRKITGTIWIALFTGFSGVALATYPLLANAGATPVGIGLLSFSMLCSSFGSVYYQRVQWSMSRLSINGWQVLVGGIGLLPFTLFFSSQSENHLHLQFWTATIWLATMVSIVAVQNWLYLLKAEPAKASLWLYLCPLFGFCFAYFLLNEPITIYTIAGTGLVITGLWAGNRKATPKILKKWATFSIANLRRRKVENYR